DLPWSDLQVEHRPVAYIAAAAWQPVLEIAIGLEIVAPGFAPEASRDGTALDCDRRKTLAALRKPTRLASCLLPTLVNAGLAGIRPPVHSGFRLGIAGFVNIQRNGAQKVLVLHLGQQLSRVRVEQIVRQSDFRLYQRVDLLFDRSPTHELV